MNATVYTSESGRLSGGTWRPALTHTRAEAVRALHAVRHILCEHVEDDTISACWAVIDTYRAETGDDVCRDGHGRTPWAL